MKGREKVIEGLKEMLDESKYNDSVQYNPWADTETLETAIALLKALDVTPEELERLKKCRHECKIDCLLEHYESIKAERDALLKAQEPRVMTLEEVEMSYSKAPIWFEELRLQTVYPAIYHKTKGPEGAKFADITDFYYQRQDWAYGTYGKTWRCWTSRPTDEQRDKEPWRKEANT